MKLEDLSREPVDPDALARLSAQLEPELGKPPPRGWRSDVLLLLAVAWGVAGVTSAVLLLVNSANAALLASHLPALGVALAAGGLAAFAAFAPPRGRLDVIALAATLGGIGGLAALRALSPAVPGEYPQWFCTLSHAGADLLPLGLALHLLRKSAPSLPRALLAGVAAGSCGAMVGEAGCGQSWQHVLVFHGGAWLLIAGAALLLSRWLKPVSYAP